MAIVEGEATPGKTTNEQLVTLGTLAATKRRGIVPETAGRLGINLDYDNLTSAEAQQIIDAVRAE